MKFRISNIAGSLVLHQPQVYSWLFQINLNLILWTNKVGEPEYKYNVLDIPDSPSRIKLTNSIYSKTNGGFTYNWLLIPRPFSSQEN